MCKTVDAPAAYTTLQQVQLKNGHPKIRVADIAAFY